MVRWFYLQLVELCRAKASAIHSLFCARSIDLAWHTAQMDAEAPLETAVLDNATDVLDEAVAVAQPASDGTPETSIQLLPVVMALCLGLAMWWGLTQLRRNRSPETKASTTETKASTNVAPETPVARAAAPRKAATAKRQLAATPSKRIAATPKAASAPGARGRRSPAVKHEPQRELPFRSSHRRHKAGFYSERNLESLVWHGTGSLVDPIRFD